MGNLNPQRLKTEHTMAQSSGSALQLLERVRAQIKARGAKTIRGLGRTFRNFDSFDGNHKIDADEFYSGLCEIQVQVTRAEANQLMSLFDTDGDGSGEITAADLRGVYNCSMHPKVQSGEMTEDEVFLEFLGSFGDKNRDGRIQRAEWNEYYAAVSSSVDDDNHFVQLMKTAWKLDQ